ncbi:MAG: nucleoside kinase [Deltaproteobacteria bacterium]|nr:nucleoside kinase [Deltaproteobacteria bacterium]
MKTIQVELEGQHLKIPESTTTLALIARKADPGFGLERPIGALVNNRLVPLDNRLHEGAKVRLVTIESEAGMEIYRRGCTLLLIEATRKLFPEVRLVVGQSLGDGYFFDWLGTPPVEPDHLEAIQREMFDSVQQDVPFERERYGVQEAIKHFEQHNLQDRMQLLSTFWHENIRLVHFGQTTDILHGPVPPSAGYLTHFGISSYGPGFVLRFPTLNSEKPLNEPPENQTKLFTIHRQSKERNRLLGVENVGTLNKLCIHGGINQLIRVSEGFHEKRIVEIANTIVAKRDKVRMVLIAGPSSSGKTTFLKRLSVQLEVDGLKPVGLSIDNYYVNREDTPRDEDGEYDFESITAIDVPLFNEHLLGLLDSKQVLTPRFNFESGKRQVEDKWVPMQLAANDILIIEGIHGLNNQLTSLIPPEYKFKVYVSALTQLCLDDHNRIHTTDARLLRRIVRDRLYRGYTAAETLRIWPSVRRGESRDIYPFQESADEMFNSALSYETAVLKVYAERFLLEVPQTDPAYPDIHRMMKFLALFVGIFPDAVPQNSILREFIGGSTFRY